MQRTYQQPLETLSLTLPPLNIDDTTAQTSTQVAKRLHAEVEALEALAARHQFPTCHATRTKVRKQLPALAALVNCWWTGVEQDVEHAGLSTPWRTWARECLFPRVSWAHHVAHTRCPRRQAKLRAVLAASQTAFDTPVLTQQLPRQALEALAGMSPPARARLSTHLVGRRRTQRLSATHAAQSAWPAQAAIHRMDGPASLRWSRCGWYDAGVPFFQTNVSRAL